MRHEYKKSQEFGKMRRLTTLLFIFLVQLSVSHGIQIQIQQGVANYLGGGCGGGPCDNTPVIPTELFGCVGNKCNVTAECTCANSFCYRGVCLCPDGYRESDNGNCELRERGVEKCFTDGDCNGNKICHQSFCICMENYKFDLSDNCIAVLGSACRDDEECLNGRHMVCEGGVCVCKPNYTPDTDQPICVENSDCTDASCEAQKRGSTCENNMCVCPSETREFAGVCAESRVGMHQDCEFTWQCSSMVNNSVCKQDYTCGCMDGYLEINGECTSPSNCSLGDVCIDDTCCLSTTPFSYCDCLAMPKVCDCKPPAIKYEEVDPPICIFAVGYDDMCVLDKECELRDNKMKCDVDSKCDCISGYTHNGFRCVVVGGIDLGAPCTPTDVCITHNSECRDGICACEEGYATYESAAGELQCVPLADPGEACTRTIECQLEDPLTVCAEDPSNPPYQICTCTKVDALGVVETNGRCYKTAPVLGDACNVDSSCQTKFPNSVCFEGHCHCDDDHVETTKCEPSTILEPSCPTDKFEKYLTSTSVTVTSKRYNIDAYPYNSVFCYSVLAPLDKILKVTIEEMVLADGTTVNFFMEPRQKIAQLSGPTNHHYNNFVFYTYANRFLVTLSTGSTRAKGFKMEVEVVDPIQGVCYEEVAVTGTSVAPTNIASMGHSPFCHVRMHAPRRSDFIVTKLETHTPAPVVANPFLLWDAVSDQTSRGVIRAGTGSTEYKLIAYLYGGITVIQNAFDSDDSTSADVDATAEAWVVDYTVGRDCGSEISATTSTLTTTVNVAAGNYKLCVWQITPATSGRVHLTVTSFVSGNNDGMFAVYCGDLTSDELGVRLNQYDYDVTNQQFDSSVDTPSLYILMSASSATAAVSISFDVYEHELA